MLDSFGTLKWADIADIVVVGLLLWAIQHRHPGAVATSVSLNRGALEKIRGWMSKLTSHRTPRARSAEASV